MEHVGPSHFSSPEKERSRNRGGVGVNSPQVVVYSLHGSLLRKNIGTCAVSLDHQGHVTQSYKKCVRTTSFSRLRILVVGSECQFSVTYYPCAIR